MEMELPEVGNQITIYNAAQGITYQYTEGQTTGFSFKDQEMTSDLGNLNMDEGITSIDELTDVFPDNMIARVEILDGEKVIYIETTENDGQNGTIDMRMWFSTRFGVPLKTEIISNGTVTMSSVVTDISADNISDSQFTPPADVVFTDFSSMNMDDLTNIPSP
jgi:outer membrane lipoprotein-sorting protein